MKVFKDVKVANNKVTVQIGIKELTDAEATSFRQFGDMQVEVGGEFGEGEGTFSLPAKSVNFPSAFPVSQIFDRNRTTPTDADQQAEVWLSAVEDRMESARDTSLSKTLLITPGYTIENV